ncbi:hypothetical protein VP01_458g1 [Puccinia sorghi]|uniref:Uncharacterized protein n=1 Tax=Puccinia sorghi TaxID=27349 RepID=A0A0L6UQK4_9BASI|nr:hypothetical protein VP01_458g1 [Puccinia sorghi]
MKSTLESKVNHLWFPTHLPPREHLSFDAQSITRPQTARLQDSSHHTVPDQNKWFIRTRGERYHPHARSDVPYYMSYGPQVMNQLSSLEYKLFRIMF